MKRNKLNIRWVIKALILLIPPLLYIIAILSFNQNIPLGDDFHICLDREFVYKYSDSIFTFLWNSGFHNEHRRFVFDLLSCINYHLIGYVNLKHYIILGNIAYVLILGVLFLTNKLKYYALLAFSLSLFQFQNYFAALWATTAIQHHFVILFGLASIYFATKKELLKSMFFTFIAIGSFGNGLALLPILAWVFFPNKKHFYILLLYSIILTIIYFSGYPNLSSHPDKFNTILEIPYDTFVHFLNSCGSAFEALGNPYYIGLCSCLYLIYLTYKRYDKSNPTVFYGLMFLLFTFIMSAISRSGLGPDQALDMRYRSFSLVYSSLLIYSIIDLFKSKFIMYFVLCICIILFINNYSKFYKEAAIQFKTNKNEFQNLSQGFCDRQASHNTKMKFKAILERAIQAKIYKIPKEIIKNENETLIESIHEIQSEDLLWRNNKWEIPCGKKMLNRKLIYTINGFNIHQLNLVDDNQKLHYITQKINQPKDYWLFDEISYYGDSLWISGEINIESAEMKNYNINLMVYFNDTIQVLNKNKLEEINLCEKSHVKIPSKGGFCFWDKKIEFKNKNAIFLLQISDKKYNKTVLLKHLGRPNFIY